VRLLIAFLLLAGCLSAQNDADREEWIELFNGRNLDGWVPKIRGYEAGDNFGDTFRVEDGLLKVRQDAYDPFDERFGHLFTERQYGYYRLRVEYRIVGEQAKGGPAWARRNSGIMVHGQSAESMGKDQDFPISIEVQLLGGLGEGPRPTANLCTPGTHVVFTDRVETRHCTSSASETYDGEDWVTVEVLVLGSARIVHFVEGEPVLEYYLPQIGGEVVSGFDSDAKQDGELLERGTISLQSESQPIDFRKVELLNLEGCMDPASPAYKSYFVRHDPAACR